MSRKELTHAQMRSLTSRALEILETGQGPRRSTVGHQARRQIAPAAILAAAIPVLVGVALAVDLMVIRPATKISTPSGSTASAAPSQQSSSTPSPQSASSSGVGYPAAAEAAVRGVVTSASPVLLPASALLAGYSASYTGSLTRFSVTYTSGAKEFTVAIDQPNPPLTTDAVQKAVTIRGQRVIYQMDHPQIPGSRIFAVWVEKGTWGENPASTDVPYYVTASGYPESEFLSLVRSLH